MGYEKKRELGEIPEDPVEEFSGLKEAIRNTERTIAENKAKGFDVLIYEQHLDNLGYRLDKTLKKLVETRAVENIERTIAENKANKIDTSVLESRLRDIKYELEESDKRLKQAA